MREKQTVEGDDGVEGQVINNQNDTIYIYKWANIGNYQSSNWNLNITLLNQHP